MSLIVLMSTYNGEKYLRQQLDSLINQDLKPTKILIRDDGSSDDTINILEEYASQYNFIEYCYGENLKPAKSFFNLIKNAPQADYYALGDQDDVWFKDKLSTAVNRLEEENKDIPLLYAGRFTITDQDLKPLNSNVSKLYSFTDFPHSLIYHTAPGCTFVFNDLLRQKVLEYDPNENYMMIHDAIIHKVACLFGKTILDQEPHMYYRQHGDNAIGLTANKPKEFINRVKSFLNGNVKNYRSNTAKSLLKVYGNECDLEKKELLDIVANYKTNKKYKKILKNDPIFRTNTVNDKFFKILVDTNYI